MLAAEGGLRYIPKSVTSSLETSFESIFGAILRPFLRCIRTEGVGVIILKMVKDSRLQLGSFVVSEDGYWVFTGRALDVEEWKRSRVTQRCVNVTASQRDEAEFHLRNMA